MSADIIVYGLVAAGLVFWLRSILGTRHGEERERPNPLTYRPEEKESGGVTVSEEKQLSPEESLAQLGGHSGRKFSVENKTAENGLLDILRADKKFDALFFLEGAENAFVMIVEAFAEGDRETLKDLLSPAVYESFDAAIRHRETNGEEQVTDIHAVRKAQIMSARLDGKMAFITVKFTADETSVTRDRDGRVIAGDPDRISEMRDVWTFSRDLRSRDPRWLVVETRADVEGGDNDLVPNTH